MVIPPAPEGTPRPSPSVRFIVIRWLVAIVALLLVGAMGVAFGRPSEREPPSKTEKPSRADETLGR